MGRGARGQGKTTEKLGFSIGAQVVCHPEAGWEPGVVVDHWYTQEGFRPSFRAPYQVQLDDEDGTLIYVPEDTPRLCRQRVLAWWEKTFSAGGDAPTASKVRSATTRATVDERDYNGTTALAESARRGWGGVVRCWTSAPAPTAIDARGRSPLHPAAAARGAAAEQVSSSVGALLAAGADPNAQDRGPEAGSGPARGSGRTALHYCAAWGHTAAAQLLLEAAADPALADGQQKTPLHLAVGGSSSREMVSLLVRAGCDAALEASRKAAAEIAQRDRELRIAEALGAGPTHWPPPGLALGVELKSARTFSTASTASTASSD